MAMVNKDNYEEYMMLYADKELNEAETKALLDFVAEHPELKAELNAYAATQVQPDHAIVFKDKEVLLQRPAKRIAIWGNWRYYAVAACTMLLIGTIFFQTKETTTTNTPIVKNTDPEKTIHETPIEQTQKELYSKQPVKTIAMETTVSKKTELTDKPKPVEQKSSYHEDRLLAMNTLNTSADFEVRTQPINISEVIVPKIEMPMTEEQQPTKTSKLAINTPLGDATKGWQQIETIFNDKLLAVKGVKEKIEDTEVRFLIGKKQLFSVRL